MTTAPAIYITKYHIYFARQRPINIRILMRNLNIKEFIMIPSAPPPSFPLLSGLACKWSGLMCPKGVTNSTEAPLTTTSLPFTATVTPGNLGKNSTLRAILTSAGHPQNASTPQATSSPEPRSTPQATLKPEPKPYPKNNGYNPKIVKTGDGADCTEATIKFGDPKSTYSTQTWLRLRDDCEVPISVRTLCITGGSQVRDVATSEVNPGDVRLQLLDTRVDCKTLVVNSIKE